MEAADPKTQLVVLLPVSEKGLIVEAAKTSGAASLSAFIRDAVLEKSRGILGRDPVSYLAPPRVPVAARPATLSAYIGTVPPEAPAVATAFPSLHGFAAHLCDRNRAILRWIGTREAETIHHLSRRFDYSYAGLSRTLRSLAGFGIVGYDVHADARCQPPYLLCRRIRLHLAFRDTAPAGPRFLSVALAGARSEGADIACASMDDFSTVVTDRGYLLLRLIATHDPPTIGALGKLTGRTSQNAYALLRRLSKFGLVGFEDAGGTRKKPVLRYDGLTLDVEISS